MNEFIPIINPNPSSSQPQLSPSLTSPPSAADASVSCPVIPEHFMHKNRLQQYCQRASLPLPAYNTVSEGFPHDPKFRSTVLVCGKEFVTPNTFSHRKEAEQEVAKIALASLTHEEAHEEVSLVNEDMVFCKSILNEYADKMQLEKPAYNTVKQEGSIPAFVSSLVFNGVTYTGDTGRSKKEAEQLAARAAILSLLGAESRKIISKILKSKRKLYVGLHKFGSQDANHSYMPVISKDMNAEANVSSDVVPKSAIPEAASALHPPQHEFTITKREQKCEENDLPITFVQPVLGQSMDVTPESAKKRRKNKRKSNKRMRTESQSSVDAALLNQVAPYSVAS